MNEEMKVPDNPLTRDLEAANAARAAAGHGPRGTVAPPRRPLPEQPAMVHEPPPVPAEPAPAPAFPTMGFANIDLHNGIILTNTGEVIPLTDENILGFERACLQVLNDANQARLVDLATKLGVRVEAPDGEGEKVPEVQKDKTA